MRILVTRPAPEAARWAAALQARGLNALALPLIHIAPLPMAGALRQARQRLGDYHAAMFVSGNAVASFLPVVVPDNGQDMPLPAALSTRAWSPGPGTTAALLRAGWPAGRIDQPAADAQQFDSEALWAQVSAQVMACTAAPGALDSGAAGHASHAPLGAAFRVLIVRGGDVAGRPSGREWLARQLRTAGAVVDEVLAYRRTPPSWGAVDAMDAAKALAHVPADPRALAAHAATDGSLWLFSSAEAIANLRQCLPGQSWQAARALVTHPRIAQAAQAAGFGQVWSTRPALDAILAAIAAIPPAAAARR